MERFGKYSLVKRLAFGGMAEIFLARLEGAEGFRKTCVLKRILPQFSADQDFVQMFVDEAILAARLEHPNVVQSYDFGNADGMYFIAMEFIDGPDLRRLIQHGVKKARSFTPVECALLGEEMCRGLSYVHNLRDELGNHLSIVHRDISPHNVMVSRAGQAKIMDFGIAKAAMRAVKTQTGTIKGKLAYMAPEQASGQPVDKRTDQFAVGLVLWECITGARHFEGNSEPELLGKVMRAEIRDVRELRPDTPAALAEVVARMLELSPGDRFADLSDAEQALNQFRFSLGAAGAVRLAHLVAQLAPPVDMTPDGSASGVAPGSAKSSEAKRPQTRSLPSGPHQPGTGEDGEAPTQWVAATQGVAQTNTLRSDPSIRDVEPVEATALFSDSSYQPSGSSQITKPSSGLQRWRPVAGALAFLALGVGVALIAMGDRGGSQSGESTATAEVAEVATSSETPSSVAEEQSDATPPAPAVGQPQVQTEVSLKVASSPSGALIRLGGVDTGLRTPATLPGQPIGETVQLSLHRDGFEVWKRSVVISVGQQPIDATLERLAPKRSPVAESQSKPPAASVRIESKPRGATVVVNGKKLRKKTPLRLTDYRVGDELSIELTLRGHRRSTSKLTIAKPQELVSRRLVAASSSDNPSANASAASSGEPGKLSLNVLPGWVEVFSDGKKLGDTPLRGLRVPSGPLKLRLKNKARGVDQTITLSVPEGGHVRRTVTLDPT